MPKKETKERKETKEKKETEVSEEILDFSSGPSSDTEGSSDTIESYEKYLKFDQLIYYLIVLKRAKREAENWVRDFNQVVEKAESMEECSPTSAALISYYLSDLSIFSKKNYESSKKDKRTFKIKRTLEK